ncbi:MAG: tRNA guanosine(34) transglycosylase Tgt [Candidatus Eremiobacteraeota bacterium]|nr:tRNA guanosine(34) transglycosylase Tgt [Candidatus Eremiobacteraeota bacterium]MBC5826772.1 tRNA guanosine(34) transglycosylase Tgt [Candidatus Eremiobacteraeota bacterium]
MSFVLQATDELARAGTLLTAHGAVDTPAFMPVGTQAAVKTLLPDDLRACDARMILANAYHCYLRPGAATIAAAGGIHAFMAWDRPILTDSGGFQVFSLAQFSRVDDGGYHFASHVDGSRHTFTPESVVELQEALGADVAMVLDDCAAGGVDFGSARESAVRTLRWADRSQAAKRKKNQLLFAIVQGSTFDDLRRSSARDLAALDFPGYGIGGLWVGESKDAGAAMVRAACEELPQSKPRYLMGVGTPEDLIRCIALGVDMFDCVYPTRCARHGLALTMRGPLNLRNARFGTDFTPLDEDCDCPACTQFTRAYLGHCFRANEAIGPRLVSMHNVGFLMRLMRGARHAIENRRFQQWSQTRLALWRAP